MFSDSDLARLYLSLEGVQLVRDLLTDTEEQSDGFDIDLLASLLSECPPEKCLLILACSTNLICDYTHIEPALKLSLKMLAGDVLDDYAPLYLAQLKDKKAERFEGQIIYMQEDLEGFAELFGLASDLALPNSISFEICATLSDQAQAQAEVLDSQNPEIDYAADTVLDEKPSLLIFSDNIIPFPGLLRKN